MSKNPFSYIKNGLKDRLWTLLPYQYTADMRTARCPSFRKIASSCNYLYVCKDFVAIYFDRLKGSI